MACARAARGKHCGNIRISKSSSARPAFSHYFDTHVSLLNVNTSIGKTYTNLILVPGCVREASRNRAPLSSSSRVRRFSRQSTMQRRRPLLAVLPINARMLNALFYFSCHTVREHGTRISRGPEGRDRRLPRFHFTSTPNC
jgi:hypothetical protein